MEQAFRSISNLSPVVVVNRFIVQHPQIQTYLGSDDSRFYPMQSEPESEPPYITYHFTSDVNSPVQWWKHEDEIRYNIFAQDVMVLDHIGRIIRNMLGRSDNSGRELNVIQKQEWGQVDYKFYYVQFMGQVDPEPTDEEGGVRRKTVLIKICYSPTSGPGLL